MVPCAAVVAGPGGGVSLSACIGGACEHKRPHVWLQAEQAFVCGAHVLHSENIVDLSMIGLAPFDAVHGIERHGLIGSLENRWLIHVIPKSANSQIYKIAVE